MCSEPIGSGAARRLPAISSGLLVADNGRGLPTRDQVEEALELGKLVVGEESEGVAQATAPNTTQLVEELAALGGDLTLHHASIIGSMAPLDQAMPLHALDQPCRGGLTDLEELSQAMHREWARTPERCHQTELIDRKITRRSRHVHFLPKRVDKSSGDVVFGLAAGSWHAA